MNTPLIIGIHGLANKPPKDQLSKWWQTSIEEGLEKNESVSNSKFDFEMIYWADQLYKNPLHQDDNFHFDALYNTEPYVEAETGALKSKKDGFLDALAAKSIDLAGETLDSLKERFGFNSFADAFLGKLLRDLDLYYQNADTRSSLRNTLTQSLKANEGRKIMLIAHSMGSIIAYDAITLLGKEKPDFRVDHFVTIGSPLGLPHVKGKIIEEFVHRGSENERVRTPTVVRSNWTNFADRKDPVALDVHLSDDYGVNKGGIICDDDLVHNDYRIKKSGGNEADKNPHKSYGYLRTPEFSKLMKRFLE